MCLAWMESRGGSRTRQNRVWEQPATKQGWLHPASNLLTPNPLASTDCTTGASRDWYKVSKAGKNPSLPIDAQRRILSHPLPQSLACLWCFLPVPELAEASKLLQEGCMGAELSKGSRSSNGLGSRSSHPTQPCRHKHGEGETLCMHSCCCSQLSPASRWPGWNGQEQLWSFLLLPGQEKSNSGSQENGEGRGTCL